MFTYEIILDVTRLVKISKLFFFLLFKSCVKQYFLIVLTFLTVESSFYYNYIFKSKLSMYLLIRHLRTTYANSGTILGRYY